MYTPICDRLVMQMHASWTIYDRRQRHTQTPQKPISFTFREFSVHQQKKTSASNTQILLSTQFFRYIVHVVMHFALLADGQTLQHVVSASNVTGEK